MLMFYFSFFFFPFPWDSLYSYALGKLLSNKLKQKLVVLGELTMFGTSNRYLSVEFVPSIPSAKIRPISR